ncbi:MULTISPECIES: citrate/2-methylcitrate synthase [Mycobacteriaceae]|nr:MULTISPECIES: citrate/2-methylcitrate synthase [Mycobacteriaceae]MBP2451853.1 citrate synthase [Mycolicibacterium lutetiense]
MSIDGHWMTADEASAALGVRKQTLYAYVSRGLVPRDVAHDPDGRRVSRFDRSHIVALAAERSRARAGVLTVLIESDVSALDPEGRLAFRGHSIAGLVDRGSFEDAAALVLQTDGYQPQPALIPESSDALPVKTAGRRSDAIRAAVLTVAATDPDRGSTSAMHCVSVAMTAVEAGCVAITGLTLESGSVATRLSSAFARSATTPALVRCFNVALTLLIDHELTASTLATRTAASVQADPWMAILAGQCAMSGPRQAGAIQLAVDVLRRWLDGTMLDWGNPLPGFGHRVYVGPDPRYELLITEVAQLDAELVRRVEGLCIEVARRQSRYPNVDLALAALTVAVDADPDCGEVLFTLARTIGLAAHAIEEYPHRLRLRMRALTSHP